jgi:hypothetical protein
MLEHALQCRKARKTLRHPASVLPNGQVTKSNPTAEQCGPIPETPDVQEATQQAEHAHSSIQNDPSKVHNCLVYVLQMNDHWTQFLPSQI